MQLLLIDGFLNYTKISDSGKTILVGIGNNSGEKLAYIKWRATWRAYVFEPLPDTIWDEKCLNSVNQFLANLISARKHPECTLYIRDANGKPLQKRDENGVYHMLKN